MKKTLIIIAIIILILSSKKLETVIIPKESIRFRVIANSNSEEDQKIKKEITNNLYKEFSKLKYKINDISDAKKQLELQIPIVESIVEETLEKNKIVKKYDINYGFNYFPEKEYKGVIYPEGEYESLVVTLGDGLGENFWCVLFPPLCLLEAEKADTSDVEYTSFIKEVLEKYF